MLNGLQDQLSTKLKSPLGDCSGRVRITFAANYLYFLYFHPRRDNLPNTIKNSAYLINLDEYHDIGTHWVALYVHNKIVTYFDSFGVEHIPKEIMKFINRTSFGLGSCRKKIITNIYRIQAYGPIMCGYFCIGFINFMFNGKSLTDYTNLFSPNDFNKNDNIILKYFGL